jgi:hypothetical protein
MRAAPATSLRDMPPLAPAPGLLMLVLFVVVVLAVLVLLTGWTGWRLYRQPAPGRLVEHGVLLLLWLWVWVSAGPHYHVQWGLLPPALLLAHLLLLVGRLALAQRARKLRG